MSTATMDKPRFKHNKYIGQVDRANGVIRHVKLLGFTSKRGRTYPPHVVQKALPLYEGVPVNIDHVDPGQRRSYRDRIGHISGVGLEPDGLYGDFHVNTAHPLAEQVFCDAENAPQNFGFSHDTRGMSRNVGGRTMVDSIDKVLSVDLVANPATSAGIWESLDNPERFTALPPEVRKELIGRQGTSDLFRQARIARTIERYSAPDPHNCFGEFEPKPAALLEDLGVEQPEYELPPADASLSRRLQRFAIQD